jgi:hypothetical protein
VAVRDGERGQASVELVAVLPLIALVGVLAWQAVVTGQALWLTGSAARAAARAQAVGGGPEAAARSVLSQARVKIADDGGVEVAVGVPAVVGRWRLGTVRARARFAPQGR